ncbi:MAG TPA: protoporphyrinogen oxidase [Terriglobales bacterium]|nr:protoporphyrinogen oxidase [Terriglobales bacterium]
MKRIAIVGGGIAGLSAAWRAEQLRRQQPDQFSYALFERANRLGGVIRTEHVDDCVVEAGPDSFLTEKPAAAELCRELGIAGELIGSNDATRKTFIVVRGRLAPMPDGLQFIAPTRLLPTAMSPLFSPSTKLRFAREYFSGRANSASVADESVADLVRRHFGQQVVDRLADPLLAGIYGGRADRLSARAVLPRMVEMEARSGSLIRGMLAARNKMQTASGARARPLFTTLRGGMQQMTDAIAARLDPRAVHAGTEVASLSREGDAWRLGPPARAERFDGIVLALPAHAAAELLRAAHPELARELAAIPHTSSLTVALAYDASAFSTPLAGFGFLVPRMESRALLACTYVHNKFPHRAPAGRVLLRCFIGGERADEMMNWDSERIVAAARDELRGILGVTARPRSARVFRWPRAMAQYEVGHLERVGRIGRMRRELPGLALAGNYLRGIGVPDCIQSGAAALAEIAQAVSGTAQTAQPRPEARV